MFTYIIIFLLFVSSIDTTEIQSGFIEEYLNKNYVPMIHQTSYMKSKQMNSKTSCLFECLNENDCSMTVFNQTNYQCMLYNIFPVINQELVFDNNIIVSVFQQTIQLSSLISNINWLISLLNTTTPTNIVSVQSPRCLIIDIFGYLLTLEAISSTTYSNRYDRSSLTLVQSAALSMTYTAVGMLMYYNGMIFVSPHYNTIYIFEHINFGLLGTINCGSSISQPRDTIFIENQNMLIIASQNTNQLFFVLFNSPTNYTCLSGLSLPNGDDPQALLKVNDTFFYVTSWGTKCVYSYHYNGGVWIPSLFANVTQSTGPSITGLGHLQIDNLQRRWVMAVGIGLVVYDQWGTFLGLWKFGSAPFDIYISNDYQLVVSDYGDSSLTLYEPNVII